MGYYRHHPLDVENIQNSKHLCKKINLRGQKSGFQIFDLPKFGNFPIGLETIFFVNSENFPVGCFPIGLVDCIYIKFILLTIILRCYGLLSKFHPKSHFDRG